MTVVLAGIGADTTNFGALAPLYDDGRFEYIPIPEKTDETTETETLGSWSLRYGEGVAADYTTRIRPQPIGESDRVVSGSDLESWPFHRDPNFETFTYGEHRTSGYVSRLRSLEPGDVVGFYAGLRRPDGERAHRYLIGYMTVDSVAVVGPETPAGERKAILDANPGNAHTKRASKDGLYLEKEVVFIDGREPGGLFERDPIKLSEYTTLEGNERAQYYLREAVASEWALTAGGRNMMYKPAYRCALDGEAFVERVGVPGERRRREGWLE